MHGSQKDLFNEGGDEEELKQNKIKTHIKSVSFLANAQGTVSG